MVDFCEYILSSFDYIPFGILYVVKWDLFSWWIRIWKTDFKADDKKGAQKSRTNSTTKNSLRQWFGKISLSDADSCWKDLIESTTIILVPPASFAYLRNASTNDSTNDSKCAQGWYWKFAEIERKTPKDPWIHFFPSFFLKHIT